MLGLSPDFVKTLRIALGKLNLTLRLGYFPRQKHSVGSMKEKITRNGLSSCSWFLLLLLKYLAAASKSS